MHKRFGQEGNCLAELKYDGQRAIIHLLADKAGVRIFSRHGHESTSSLPDVVEMIKQVAENAQIESAIFDSEVPVLC